MPPLPLIMQQQHSATELRLALCSQLSSFNWSIWYSLHLSHPWFFTCRCITWGANPPASLAWARSNGRKSTNKHLKVKTGLRQAWNANMKICRFLTGHDMVQVVNESQHDNFTESVVLYHPRYLDIYISTISTSLSRPGHHGHSLTCSATSPELPGHTVLEDSLSLEIFCESWGEWENKIYSWQSAKFQA